MTTNQIAAVVVTRNRKALLQRCIKALIEQTHPLDAVFVVDVASTDGTAELLESAVAPVIVIQVYENVGGAGGQNIGIANAHAAGYEWIWCMDDDGYPETDALERIVHQFDNTDALWINSLVLDIDNHTRLAFPFVLDHKEWRDAAEVRNRGNLLEEANPFNGTLINRKLVDAVGLPAKELFIWGDEEEYKRRARSHGIGVRTVTDSIFYHPATADSRLSCVPLAGFWKYYYQVRNCNARVTKSGDVILSKRDAWRLASGHTRQLVVDSFRNYIKIAIVLRAFVATVFNDLSRRYPK